MKSIALCLSLAAFVTGCSARSEVVIRGNSHGVWSPTHPHFTWGRKVPVLPSHVYEVSPVHVAPPPVVTEEIDVSLSVFDTCPTLLSAPHLCQNGLYKI